MEEGCTGTEPPVTDVKQNGFGDSDANLNEETHLEIEHDEHLKIYIEIEDPEIGSVTERVYPDDTHIHDEHELAKPKITPQSRLQ